jgi:predicted nucleotidyltransferase
MAEILPLGRFYETDGQGCLINESRVSSIQAPWLAAVDDAKERCIRHFSDRLQSLYLRGSVPRGLAVEGVSDIDFVVLLRDDAKAADDDREWAASAREELKKLHPFASDIEYAVSPAADYLAYAIAKVTIKVRACLLYGDDLAVSLAPVKPDASLARALDYRLRESLEQFTVEARPMAELEQDAVRWIAKRIVRSGMSLVLARTQRFSPDLYPQYRCFSECYPQHEATMRRALELAINADFRSPDDDSLLSEFGPWMVGELKRQRTFLSGGRSHLGQ